jgi:pimeloyl-ACP methyl ester carboxylesterase
MLTVDGVPVGTIDVGDGPGAPLLLLHGFTGSKEDFAAVAKPLAATRRVIAIDLPGHGESPGPTTPSGYGLDAVAPWLLRAADALGLGEFHLLGHSMGGLIAQRVGSLASHRLLSLILMGTGMGALRDDVAELVAGLAVLVRDEGMPAAWEAIRLHAEAEGLVDIVDDVERAAFEERRFLDGNPAAVIGGARVLINAAPHGAFLRGVDLPVLVVHGEDDHRWTPAEQARLAAVIPKSRYEVIAGARHSPQLENTDDWLEVVTGFLRSVDGSVAAWL